MFFIVILKGTLLKIHDNYLHEKQLHENNSFVSIDKQHTTDFS